MILKIYKWSFTDKYKWRDSREGRLEVYSPEINTLTWLNREGSVKREGCWDHIPTILKELSKVQVT